MSVAPVLPLDLVIGLVMLTRLALDKALSVIQHNCDPTTRHTGHFGGAAFSVLP